MPEDVLKKLGARIRKARKDRDMTQDQLYQLACILEISLDTIIHPAWDANDPVLKDIIDSYRSCPPQGRLFLQAAIRAISNEIRISEKPNTSFLPSDKELATIP